MAAAFGFVGAILLAVLAGDLWDFIRATWESHASAHDARGTRGTGSWR